MSTHEPADEQLTYRDTEEAQADLEGLLEEEDGDFQKAVDDQLDGEKPEEQRLNEPYV